MFRVGARLCVPCTLPSICASTREIRLQAPENESSTPLGAEGTPALQRNPVFFNERGLRAGWRLLSWIGICIVFGVFLLAISAPIRHVLPHDIAPDVAKLLVVAAILGGNAFRSEEHTSELQSRRDLVCRLLLEKKKRKKRKKESQIII